MMSVSSAHGSGGASDRRRADRTACRFPATLSIVIPEETFSPFTAIVYVTDVSDEGMRLLCPVVNNPWLEHLKRGQFVRLLFRHEERMARLYCELMWMLPRKRMIDGVFFEMGVRFDLADPLTNRTYMAAIDRARATANIPRTLQGIPLG